MSVETDPSTHNIVVKEDIIRRASGAAGTVVSEEVTISAENTSTKMISKSSNGVITVDSGKMNSDSMGLENAAKNEGHIHDHIAFTFFKFLSSSRHPLFISFLRRNGFVNEADDFVSRL